MRPTSDSWNRRRMLKTPAEFRGQSGCTRPLIMSESESQLCSYTVGFLRLHHISKDELFFFFPLFFSRNLEATPASYTRTACSFPSMPTPVSDRLRR